MTKHKLMTSLAFSAAFLTAIATMPTARAEMSTSGAEVGDREAAERAVSDDLIDATGVAGTPEQCRARVEAYRQSGIDVPILSPFARGPDAKSRFEAAIRACAPTKSG
jgi:alkanesulfonate monooxygenase SsuD/methylene tetrahydromethanopterin reductase-like flavin-dependent oxidoreductase (luciferase family)